MMNFDTVLVDVNCVAHLAYAGYWGDYSLEDMSEYIQKLQNVYFRFPFLKTHKFIVFGDSKPYWRTRHLSREQGVVYKGTRAERSETKIEFLNLFSKMAGAICKRHFEADDLIAAYISDHPQEKICILTVDSDLLQLAKDSVTWFCCKGYYPQVRSESNGNLKVWLDKKFSKLSQKRIGHLDTNKADSIIEWKVIYGDKADNIPAGELSRCLIDLKSPVKSLDVHSNHPDFKAECDRSLRIVDGPKTPYLLVDQYETETMCTFPTRFAKERDWLAED
jgi:5'-3' exonuclease